MTQCTSPLGSVGGSQFSSIPSWYTLVMVISLGGEGTVERSVARVGYIHLMFGIILPNILCMCNE